MSLLRQKYVLFGLYRDFDDDDLVDGLGSITLQDVETRLIQLDPSIQDTMWYVWRRIFDKLKNYTDFVLAFDGL